MRAILVSVEYGDILAITLPYNRHHFEEVMVVTSTKDIYSQQIAAACNASVYATDSFYDDGAMFNKWLALETALDAFGRRGLMCIMDADIAWPKRIDFFNYQPDYLYTPQRYIWPSPTASIPPENEWTKLEKFSEQEWAGYTQIFWADDLHLPKPPWHQTDWIHAGGADSYFQQRWPNDRKRRPGFRCLHFGQPGRNWAGRVAPYLDGTYHPEADQRHRRLAALLAAREATVGTRQHMAGERLIRSSR